MSREPSDPASATVRRWQLTDALRQLREAAGLTIEQAVDQLRKDSGRWSKPKLSRIENRNQGVKPREVEQLLKLYGADPQTRARLLELAESVSERGWWLAYRRDLPEDFHPFLNLEIALVSLRQFETMLVPGLLQTGEYARALINGITPGLPAEQVDRRVAARMARQQLLTSDRAPEFHVILEEAILERPVGKPATMRAQLRRLAEAAESPTVMIQVLPKSAGPHPGMEGPFSILSLPEPVPDVGYVEGICGAVYLESHEDVRRCTLRFGILTERALTPKDSIDLILSAAEGYR